MQRIKDQSHNKYTLTYAISKMFERSSYYGVRSLIVLYMISEVLNLPKEDALNIYGWFAGSILLSQIIGALLGDLLIGNKKAIIIGGIIQSLGAFSFCISSINGLYLGLLLITLGSGLYSPNMISSFGKLYWNKTKLLDAGFTIFHLAINLGAFIGIVSIGYVGDEYGWNTGFIIAGIMMLLSLIPILLARENEREIIAINEIKNNQRIINISIAVVLVGLFWAIYEISNIRFFDLQIKLSEVSTLGLPKSIWSSINSFFTLPISLLAIFVWTYFYNSQFFKLMVGFICGSISFGILFLIPENPLEQHSFLYLISILLLAVSEIHISPIIQSVITKHSNPKYLAILISLTFIPTKLFSFIIGYFNDTLYENPSVAILIALIAMTVLSLGLIIYYKINKNYLQQAV